MLSALATQGKDTLMNTLESEHKRQKERTLNLFKRMKKYSIERPAVTFPKRVTN